MAKQHILVIDDEPETVDMLKQFLELFEFEVTGSLTGNGGMQIAINSVPQAIVLDLMLPDADGYQICRLMRHHPSLRKTPILILSARIGKDDEIKGLSSGATVYLRKPIELNKLVEELRQAIATGHIPAAGMREQPAPHTPATKPGAPHDSQGESSPAPVESQRALKKKPATLHIPGMYIPRDVEDKKDEKK